MRGRADGVARLRSGGARTSGQEPPQDGAAAQDREPDPESVARTIALRLLTQAPRSRSQLAEAMSRRGVDDAVAERVLDRFEEVGLVDDIAYAHALVRTRHADRGLARRALAVELRRKGIDPDTAQEALDTLDSEREERTARELVRRRWAATAGLDTDRRMRRIVGMLGRKGYSPSLALRLVREMVEHEGTPQDDVDGPWE